MRVRVNLDFDILIESFISLCIIETGGAIFREYKSWIVLHKHGAGRINENYARFFDELFLVNYRCSRARVFHEYKGKIKSNVVIGTDCIGSCKSNYHTIMTAPSGDRY